MTLARITLNVFTNVASPDPAHCLAGEAIRSFFECFSAARGADEVITRIFIHPAPFANAYAGWKAKVLADIGDIPVEFVETKGLIDGFARSLELTDTPYAMQLEHDFVFVKSRIPHGLGEMTEAMKAGAVNYLRFNKRRNFLHGYDLFMDEVQGAHIPMCRISGRSNNPHLIDVEWYRRIVLPILDAENGAEIGLEGGLCRLVGGGNVYGPPGWPTTARHLDGRRVRKMDAVRRWIYFLKKSVRA